MDTLAVVCDDRSECDRNIDEAQCKHGTDKYKPLVYSLTAGTSMFYVVLKLYWFFYQRHQLVGDEDDEESMDMDQMEL